MRHHDPPTPRAPSANRARGQPADCPRGVMDPSCRRHTGGRGRRPRSQRSTGGERSIRVCAAVALGEKTCHSKRGSPSLCVESLPFRAAVSARGAPPTAHPGRWLRLPVVHGGTAVCRRRGTSNGRKPLTASWLSRVWSTPRMPLACLAVTQYESSSSRRSHHGSHRPAPQRRHGTALVARSSPRTAAGPSLGTRPRSSGGRPGCGQPRPGGFDPRVAPPYAHGDRASQNARSA
jgi:hypothetical protein